MRKETSTNTMNDKALQKFCNAYKNLSQLTGRWKVSLIFVINEEAKSYSELKLEIPNITDRILSKQLSELQENKIIENEKDKTKSIYTLSAKGLKILTLLQHINELDLT